MSNTCVFAINSPIAKSIGLESALVVSQIQYWINHCGRSILGEEGKWIYNSLEKWHKQFSFWSLSKLRRIIKSLENQNLIISKKVNSKKWNHTKWYSINQDEYNKLFDGLDLIKKKRTNRCVQNEQMLFKETKNNYTKKSSYRREDEIFKEDNRKTKFTQGSNFKQNIPSKEQITTAQQMVQSWNDYFECSLKPVKAFMNAHTIVQLNKILQTKFNNDLKNWKQYAQAINSSKFLMGEKETKSNFKAQFLWLIKEETIDSIQSGSYGIGDRVLDSEKVEENLKVCQREVQQMVQDKMSVTIQEKTSSAIEEQEFRQYLIGREYEKDGDKYLIRKHMDSIGSEYMYGGYITPSHVFYPGNDKYKQRLFQSYLMKKYYGIDESEISLSFDEVKKDRDGKSMLLKFKNIREKLKFGVFQNRDFNNNFVGLITDRMYNINLL